jgi:Raf kinase inhibitor-like YbhB/YbcL family protein
MKVSKLRAALVAAALGIGAGAACAASAGSAAASTSASAQAQAHQHHHGRPDPYEFLPKVASFTVVSTTVRNGHPLPAAQLSGIFGVPGGKDISPELSWSGFPEQTKSFVISMYDPEAPTGSGFWHWIVEDVRATTTSLPEDAGALHSTTLPAGAIQLDGDAGTPRYIGGAPPAGSGIHDYYITITALNEPSTGLAATTSGALLGFEIDSHTIARATIVCPTAIK